MGYAGALLLPPMGIVEEARNIAAGFGVERSMRTFTRLGLYGLGLAVVFAASFAVATAVVPEDAGEKWTASTEAEHADDGGHGEDAGSSAPDAGHGDGHESGTATAASEPPPGLSVEWDGYRIDAAGAPKATGEPGTLSFRLLGPDGEPVTAYDTAHEKQLHLIVVRTDGTGFRHVHPATDGAGVWSIPWRWDRAGSYRVYADFVPTALGEQVTLTSTIDVAGPVEIAPRRPESTTATVDGLTVSLDGEPTAGEESHLTFTVTRDGAPVTTLQPYLGAYGHLVALRDGDLAYLHVHPLGEPGDGRTPAGPEIEFAAEAPTPGRYLLYLDFQVDGTVHTASFVVHAH